MLTAIREAGRTPVQRNTFYEPIRILEDTPPPEACQPPPEALENPAHSIILEDNLATA